MTQRFIDDWRIVPVEGNRVCIEGKCEGRFWRTTHIVGAALHNGVKCLKTISGTVYLLGTMEPGMWLIQLQLKRSEQYSNLVKQGIL